MTFEDPTKSLTAVLRRIPPRVAQVMGAAAPTDRAVSAVTIVDPQRPDAPLPSGAFALAVGVADDDIPGVITAAGRSGAAALAVRATGHGLRRLSRLAAAAGVVLLALDESCGWGELHAMLSETLFDPRPRDFDDDLADIAQTLAVLAGGLVTIEDTGSRVLAYSSSGDDVDELRRLSILGREGPASYLALLREWGVYERLAAPDDVVEIGEHAELGIRPRLAIGAFVGREQVATIWVQRGTRDFPPGAHDVLRGAARLAASVLAGDTSAAALRARQDALVRLLDGVDTRADWLGRRSADRPAIVAAFDLGRGRIDAAVARRRVRELRRVVGVHAAALRADAVVADTDDTVYALLPGVAQPATVTPFARAVVDTARRHIDEHARAAVGPTVSEGRLAAQSRRGADDALTASTAPVVVFDDARATILVDTAVAAAAARPDLHDAQLAALLVDEPGAGETLRAYLAAHGDVAATAQALGVHATTVRYRLRRLEPRFDLTNPSTRLALHLQLLAAARPVRSGPVMR